MNLFSVLGVNHSPLAQEFSKKGIPVSYRGKLWCQIFNVDVDDVVSLTISALYCTHSKYKHGMHFAGLILMFSY